jgi:hypothetical protein
MAAIDCAQDFSPVQAPSYLNRFPDIAQQSSVEAETKILALLGGR